MWHAHHDGGAAHRRLRCVAWIRCWLACVSVFNILHYYFTYIQHTHAARLHGARSHVYTRMYKHKRTSRTYAACTCTVHIQDAGTFDDDDGDGLSVRERLVAGALACLRVVRSPHVRIASRNIRGENIISVRASASARVTIYTRADITL